MQDKRREREINNSEARLETQDRKRHTFGKNGNPTTITHNETETNSTLGLGLKVSCETEPGVFRFGIQNQETNLV
jgi:hypothetical protein